MSEFDVKKVMEQVHISPEMQEEIIVNIQTRMENGNKDTRTWNWKKMATAAAVFALAAGVVGFPVRALVTSVVRERMESVPKEEMQSLNDMVQSKPTEADVFSREYSAGEEERNHELWQAYKDGKFPENVIAQADDEADAPEGTVCYIRSTGVFRLPDQEMTDEEMLEIIDFQHKMSYAVSQGPAAQEARAEMQAEENKLRERIKAAGGISEEEAIEIAEKAMAADLGEKAKELEVIMSPSRAPFGWKVYLFDITDWPEYKDKGDIAYSVDFGNKEEVVEPKDFCRYNCFVNAVDGSICGASSLSGDVGPDWDIDDIVWYDH